jgi:hypothetical protein
MSRFIQGLNRQYEAPSVFVALQISFYCIIQMAFKLDGIMNKLCCDGCIEVIMTKTPVSTGRSTVILLVSKKSNGSH